jgi:hypothetical protein
MYQNDTKTQKIYQFEAKKKHFQIFLKILSKRKNK